MQFKFQQLILIAILLVGILAMAFSSWSCSQKMDSITVGTIPHEENALTYIAQDRNFFADNGLNVTFKDYESGPTAVLGMLKNEVNIAMASDFVLASTAFNNQDVRVFGTIAKALIIDVIGRTDKGVKNISDLKGKRIGLSLKTSSEFYLGRFLDLHGMNINQVTLVNVTPAQSVDALVNGEVDAVVAWQPNVNLIQDRLANGIVIWPAQSDQSSYWDAISSQNWIAANPDIIKRFLKSLSKAETYLTNNPAQAKTIIQKKMNYTEAYLANIWPQYQFSLSLDQSQIVAMEGEARWAISNNLTSSKSVPDFLNYVYLDGLKAVEPVAVNITK